MVVLEMLKNGAKIGCEGQARLPSHELNSKSTYQYGDRVANALLCWIKGCLCFGPLDIQEVPFESYKINHILEKLKQNGHVRI